MVLLLIGMDVNDITPARPVNLLAPRIVAIDSSNSLRRPALLLLRESDRQDRHLGDTSMQQTAVSIHPQPWKPPPFMPVSAQVYSEIQQFLIYEALLLDHGCFDQWSALLARDITYSVCNCSGQERVGLNAAEFLVRNRESLLLRIGCPTQTASAPRVEQRLPATRRFVTNVSVSFAHCRNEYDVVSYLRVAQISHGGTMNSAWSSERHDRLRATDRAFAISRRELLIDSIEPGIAGPPQFL
jgi:3-phenylpropionate/cinnamic acid dioxygenase small subunit